jgi:hypothetical protein
MARIPIYQERQQVSGGLGMPEMRAPNVGAEAIGRSLQQVGQGLQNLALGQLRMEDETGKAEAMRVLSEAKLSWTEDFIASQETAPIGGVGFTKSYDERYQAWANKTLEGTQNEYARKYLQTGLASLRESLVEKSLVFEVSENRAFRISQADDSITNNSKFINANPSNGEYQKSLGETLAMIDAMKLPPQQRAKLVEKAVQDYGVAQTLGLIKQNPSQVVKSTSRVAAGAGFRPVMDFVFAEEGSAYVENDAGAGPGKYGIVEQYNPGWNAKSGTKDQAEQIYLQNYWNKIDGGSLPPKIAAVAMDTAVLMGVSASKRLLERSGGDVNTFLDLRKQELTEIAKRPDKAQYLNVWMARTERLRSFANGIQEDKLAPVSVQTDIDGFNALPLQKQLELSRAAITAENQNESIYRAQVKDRLSNSNAMAVNGVTDPNPIAIGDFVRAFGVEEGEKQSQIYQDNQVMARDIASIKTMPTEDINTLLSVQQPKAGADYEVQSKRHKLLVDAAMRVERMRKDDPAAFAAQSSPRAKESMERLNEINIDSNATPEQRSDATRQFALETLAEQERLGIRDPKVLTAPMVDSLTARMGSGKESAADTVAYLEQTYKEYFPQVMNELLAKGKLPPAMMIIPNIDSPITREAVARVAPIKMQDLEVGISDKTYVRDVKEKVAVEVAKLRTSAGNLTGQSVAEIDAYSDSMIKLALEGYGGKFTSAKEAVKAVNQMILGKYQFTNGNTLRLPADVDARKVRNGLNDRIPDVIKSLGDTDIPIDRTGARTIKERRDAWESDVRANSVWIADPETKGAYLFVKLFNNQLTAVRKNGEPVFYSWQEALEKSTAQTTRLQEVIDGGALSIEQMPNAQEAGVGITR